MSGKSAPGFRSPELTDMTAVGAVTPHSARIWVRTERAGGLRVRWKTAAGEEGGKRFAVDADGGCDLTGAVELGEGDGGLRAGTRYRYKVLHDDGHQVGEGSFETAPASAEETPARFSIALMSCHQPFDASGEIREDARQMLRAVLRCFEENDTKLVFMMGDQMYSDYPPELSLVNPDFFPLVAPPGREKLVDCTAEEVRRLYQKRYRHFWNVPEWKALQTGRPCYTIWDDHDIVDNWGSDPAHGKPPWSTVGEGARLAYFDYQGSRVLPSRDRGAFHYSVVYGNTATFVMDLRAERKAGDDGRLFSDAQETALVAFLDAHREKPVVFIVLSVPIIQLPEFLSRIFAQITPPGEDFSDRWSSGAHIRDRDRMLRHLHDHQRAHPRQQVVLLSGDIHIGCAHEFRWKDLPGNPLHQFISSGITNSTSWFTATASELLIRMHRRLEIEDEDLEGNFRLLKGEPGLHANPFGRLNMGLVEVDSSADRARPELRYSLFGHENGEPVRVFRSHVIQCG